MHKVEHSTCLILNVICVRIILKVWFLIENNKRYLVSNFHLQKFKTLNELFISNLKAAYLIIFNDGK